MQNQTKEAIATDWLFHIEGWKESGLSQSAYCRQVGINNKQFHYHLHRLSAREQPSALTFIKTQAVLKPVEQEKIESKTTVRLVLTNGVQVQFEDIVFGLVPQILKLASTLSC